MTTPEPVARVATPRCARRIPAAAFDADREVREKAAAAEARAGAAISEARAAASRILEEARAEGFREGLARAAAALAGAAAERDRLLASVEGEVASLALEIARKVLGRHAAGFPEAVADLAARALHEARGCREVTIRVHPEDAAPLRSGEGALASILARAPLQVREDPSLVRGDVVVETEAGRIEAGIASQLASLARALEEAGP